jgi:hypothetical protein
VTVVTAFGTNLGYEFGRGPLMTPATPQARMATVSYRRMATLLAIVALTTACSSSHRSATPYTATTTTVGKEPACDATRTVPYARSVSSSAGSVWVWVESGRGGFRTGSLIKVVWRITGRGVPTVELQQPDGRSGALSFGPERHSSSTFRHPGDEYGSGFIPTTRGCWRMNMQRGAVSGQLSFVVA